jgi:hypothetical protein
VRKGGKGKERCSEGEQVKGLERRGRVVNGGKARGLEGNMLSVMKSVEVKTKCLRGLLKNCFNFYTNCSPPARSGERATDGVGNRLQVK